MTEAPRSDWGYPRACGLPWLVRMRERVRGTPKARWRVKGVPMSPAWVYSYVRVSAILASSLNRKLSAISCEP